MAVFRQTGQRTILRILSGPISPHGHGLLQTQREAFEFSLLLAE